MLVCFARRQVRSPAMSTPSGRVLALVVALIVVTGCTEEPPPTTTTTTVPPTTIGVDITSVGPAAVTVGTGVDESVAQSLQGELETLRATTEGIRGLRFLDPPRVALVTDAEFETRRAAALDAEIDTDTLAVQTRLMRTMGLIGPADDLEQLFREVAAEDVPAFYDPTAEELVVATSTDLSAYDRSILVREMVRALVDVYHRYGTRIPELRAEGRQDEADALAALATADATFFQLVYLQGLPNTDQVAAAAVRPVTTVPLPEAVNVWLSFPFESGIPFIEALVQEGGIGELDRAYGADPLTTEYLRYPTRYMAAETVRTVPPVTAPATGYTVQDAGTWGSAALEPLLVGGVSGGILTQTIDGWGGDGAALYTSPNGMAFVYTFRGDTVDDTVEVAQAFLNHAIGPMGMSAPVNAGGGVEHVGLADAADPETSGPYMFVDRESEGLVVVVSDDPTVGRSLRDSVPVP